ncbi:MAG TPA: RidA family protein, partial [Burkholderiales bacterium]|nr:RidA family protein [Burkholderiales bacterium]
LEYAGGNMSDIASMTVFVTNMADLAAIHEVRAEFFEQPYPASTLVQVAALVRPELMIEINAVAVVRQP